MCKVIYTVYLLTRQTEIFFILFLLQVFSVPISILTEDSGVLNGRLGSLTANRYVINL